MSKSRLIVLVPLALFLVLAGYFAVGLSRDPAKLPSMLIGKATPNFDLPELGDSGRFTPAALKGQVTLVNFFASWCLPCRSEHPILMGLKKSGVRIIGVAYKDKPDNAKRLLDDDGNPFEIVAVDLDGQAGIDWGVYGVPETYVIDRDGVVRYRQVAAITPNDLDTVIKPLLAELNK